MSGSRKNSKSDEGSGGFGFGAAVLLGAGAAAVGFLARDMWNAYQEFQGQSSTSGGSGPRPPPGPPPRSPTSDWGADDKPDKNYGARKKQRQAFRDNNVSDEMKCIICYDNPREVVLIPCGHVCMCEDCADKIDTKCPMCQQVYTSKKAVYM